jgi:hypothetical protein
MGEPAGPVTGATLSIASARAAFPPLGEGNVAHAVLASVDFVGSG